jgi:hypothetical protein
MPDLSQFPPALYQVDQPYQRDFDNIPLQNLMARIDQVNLVADLDNSILEQAQGTAGNLAARLYVALNDNGSLKSSAIDTALHNIAMHEDGVDASNVSYVRMLAAERDRLTEVADNATALRIMFDAISSVVVFDNQTIEMRNSPSIYWEIESPDPSNPEAAAAIRAYTTFSTDAAHQHFYDITPVDADPFGTSGTTYQVTSMSTPYMDGSLRVYLNGVRLSADSAILVPSGSGTHGKNVSWKHFAYNPSASSGTFVVTPPISSTDVIRIDFDVALT